MWGQPGTTVCLALLCTGPGSVLSALQGSRLGITICLTLPYAGLGWVPPSAWAGHGWVPPSASPPKGLSPGHMPPSASPHVGPGWVLSASAHTVLSWAGFEGLLCAGQARCHTLPSSYLSCRVLAGQALLPWLTACQPSCLVRDLAGFHSALLSEDWCAKVEAISSPRSTQLFLMLALGSASAS